MKSAFNVSVLLLYFEIFYISVQNGVHQLTVNSICATIWNAS